MGFNSAFKGFKNPFVALLQIALVVVVRGLYGLLNREKNKGDTCQGGKLARKFH
jgi:hypothetical protein